ncbi:RNA 2',3'-cyclic phosphodiesterase [Lacisediminimonas sp.]|uniref:RNA 2',3'-cyclic phosphodiesterase n=1 Tax=Lacisediminimonas sp. TaxID=3060582 RepID=UPI0027208995|nr:RNA 2',3'-cyclic phosphodiesterase [Lacisediminimonas sp.]MDO8300870.1 RNA 2',3'-cyclic phosphodiesterase [Lacisediminimonas sp.]
MSQSHRASERLFLALWPPAAVRAALAALLPAVQGRRVQPDNLHITMVFLGQQQTEQIPALQAIARQFSLPAIMLVIDRLGYFKRNRIAWAGMQHPPPELLAAQRALANQLKQAGFEFDHSGTFRPHVTLARAADAPDMMQIAPILWQPTRIVLVSSRPGTAGVNYKVLND